MTNVLEAPDGARTIQPEPGGQAALLNVGQVAELLGCSVRHTYRMADAGRMPRPIKLGALVRWPRAAIESWIAAGCPSCRR